MQVGDHIGSLAQVTASSFYYIFPICTTFSALQYQQAWAYANNVNLLAANSNWQFTQSTGSGIYAGRLGALKSFVNSEILKSKILVAKIPTQLPSVQLNADESPKDNAMLSRPTKVTAMKNDSDEPIYDKNHLHEDLTKFRIEFLNFSMQINHSGTVCKDGLCCHYDIGVRDSIDTMHDDSRVCMKCGDNNLIGILHLKHSIF